MNAHFPAPRLADRTEAAALRTALSPWTVDAVEQVIGQRATAALAREQVVPARVASRAAGREPVAILTRLLMLGEQVDRAAVDAALPHWGAEGLIRAGVAVAAGADASDGVRAVVDLRPYAADDGTRWWIASDLPESVTGSRLRDSHVLGVGGASLTLASVTVRTPVDAVLDLGTGCGIQALHASTHARDVTATDVSQRALDFARFNKALNAPDSRWDVRHGSLLEPVADELFDLVVSNPPFVITPPGAPAFDYRDGGMRGDGIVSALISGVGRVLAPGGVAQLLGNWEIRRGEEWGARIGQWLDASEVPLDAWIVQRDVLDAAEYAETWLRDAGITPQRDRAAFDSAYEAYVNDFDARGVGGIGFGVVTLRRSAVPTLRRLEEHEGAMERPLGPHIARVLAAHDLLETLDDGALLDTSWTVAADVTRETYGRPLDPDPQHIMLRQGGGLGRSIRMDTALAGFVGACDGELTAGQIAGALSALLDVPAAPMRSGLAAAIRDLARDGFLLTD